MYTNFDLFIYNGTITDIHVSRIFTFTASGPPSQGSDERWTKTSHPYEIEAIPITSKSKVSPSFTHYCGYLKFTDNI